MVKLKTGIVAAAVVLGFAGQSSVAQAGFFEQLFGIPDPQPYYGSPRPAYAPPPRHVRPKRRVVAEAKPPKRQMPTDLMHDATLRPGDAVMMKSGMHIYEGDDRTLHNKRDFVALDDVAGVPKKLRAELVALDTTRNDPLLSRHAPDTIASGRSAAVATPISTGFKFVDARGKTVRYVGP